MNFDDKRRNFVVFPGKTFDRLGRNHFSVHACSLDLGPSLFARYKSRVDRLESTLQIEDFLGLDLGIFGGFFDLRIGSDRETKTEQGLQES